MYTNICKKLRPTDISDISGQNHLVDNNGIIKNIISTNKIPNMIFYGPPGVGKTTVAKIISAKSKMKSLYLNGTNTSSQEIKDIILESKKIDSQKGILLHLDEIQYLNKKQQQTLLEVIEEGNIILIACMTENPCFYIHDALLSRCMVLKFEPLKPQHISNLLIKAIDTLKKELNVNIICSDNIIEHIANFCLGDARKALNTLEMCVLSSQTINSEKIITMDKVTAITNSKSLPYNKSGDDHYNLLSAFQKSIRGSDTDAALHYLAKLLEFGEILSCCRRLMICVCEDVGLAYPQIIPIVKSCVDIAMSVGMPEAKIPLADAVILACISPKSNSAYLAINKAFEELHSKDCGFMPEYLRQSPNLDFKSNKNSSYLYPHHYKNSWINQQYLPEKIKNSKYYKYGKNKNEQAFKSYWENIKNKTNYN